MPGQDPLFSDQVPTADTSKNASTFSDNLSLPINRWFRYSAGFSAPWVRSVVHREKQAGRSTVLDPFAGSGTALLESESCGLESTGLEAHPFVARVARAKLSWREDPELFRHHTSNVLRQARATSASTDSFAPLIHKCFTPDVLGRLGGLLKAWMSTADDSPISELSWLTMISILRESSQVGTAQWQYVLPNKRKVKVSDPFDAFAAKAELMAQDMQIRQGSLHGPEATLHLDDARTCSSVPDGWADLIVTSPPYANNYDYADATRLEMSFLGEIEGWGDLQHAVRRHLVRSCTQHVGKMSRRTEEMLEDPLLRPIEDEIKRVCADLGRERENHGGKKAYHTMIAAYFSDLARVWRALRRVSAEGALVCFVVGDSAPYGVHVPVERWLGELAVAAGFESYRFEKTRDRNVKWKNRKHRVPLQEGRLWVDG